MNANKESLIGFLSVIELREEVLIGGYLILNSKGRPVEFHCTSPVQPNRAQQILYGTALRPYLCGERIGQALVRQSKQRPELVCVDVADAIDLREHVSMPIILLTGGVDDNDSDDSSLPNLFRIVLGSTVARIHPADQDRRSAIESAWSQFENIDLEEPFGRIYEAIREAQKDAAA